MFISKSIWKLFDERLSKITWIQYTSNRFTLQSFINYTISYRSELELKLNFMLFENNMHALKMNEVMWTKLLKIIILRERRKGKHKTSQIHSHDDQFWYLFLNKLQLNEIALLTAQIISLLLNSLVQFNCKYTVHWSKGVKISARGLVTLHWCTLAYIHAIHAQNSQQSAFNAWNTKNEVMR